MAYATIMGTLGAVLTTLAYFPQAYKVFKTKETEAISLAMFLMMNIGIACWLVYGYLIGEQPLIWANTLTLTLSGYIFYVKMYNVIKCKEKP